MPHSCIMMSENPANRERTQHVDTRVHYLRELVRDGHVKLLKCAGPQNVADALTKSLPRPALSKHRQYMWGTRIPFSAFISLSRLDGITSLLENAVSWKIKRGGLPSGGLPSPTLIHGHALCLSGTKMVHGRARAPPRQTWRVA